jgi:hypothetical protein
MAAGSCSERPSTAAICPLAPENPVSKGRRGARRPGVVDVQARDVAPRACASSARAPAPAPCRSHDEAAARIHAYLTDRGGPSRAVRDLAVLFVRHDRSAFTPAALRRLVERWYASAGVRRHPGAAVHALRHTWTTPRSTPATETARAGSCSRKAPAAPCTRCCKNREAIDTQPADPTAGSRTSQSPAARVSTSSPSAAARV